MTAEEILNQRVTLMDTIDTYPKKEGAWMTDVPLIQVLLATNWNDKIEEVRRLNTPETKAEYKSYKNHNLPAWTVSGTFPHFSIGIDRIKEPNHIIALDIDVKEDENAELNIQELKKELFSKPYVVAVLDSVGGKGIYVLVYVKDYTHTTGYYYYLMDLYKQQYNVSIDDNAMDLARRRFVSTQPDICKWIKPNKEEIIPWELYCSDDEILILKGKSNDIKFDQVIPLHLPTKQTTLSFDEELQKERTHQAMWILLNNGFNAQDRGYWYHIGRDLAAFPDGKEMFEKLCSNWGSQDHKSIENTWKCCVKKPSTIDDEMHRKWQGMAKNRLGNYWWKKQVTNK